MITPAFTGQIYRDTATGNIWKANSTTPGDWTLLVQDTGLTWTPKNTGIISRFSLETYNGLTGITNLVSNQTTMLEADWLEACSDLQTISYPNLATISALAFNIRNCPVLTQVSMPALTGSMQEFQITGNTLLTTVNLSSFVTLPGNKDLYLYDNPALTAFALPALVPNSGMGLYISGCGLNLASVDGLLSRFVANAAYVSGNIDISGGTNIAPTQGAGSPHDILVARGVTITHN